MQLENVSGLRINTVILDCEGCWTDFVVTYQDKFQHQIDKIILGKLFNLNHSQTLLLHIQRMIIRMKRRPEQDFKC